MIIDAGNNEPTRESLQVGDCIRVQRKHDPDKYTTIQGVVLHIDVDDSKVWVAIPYGSYCIQKRDGVWWNCDSGYGVVELSISRPSVRIEI